MLSILIAAFLAGGTGPMAPLSVGPPVNGGDVVAGILAEIDAARMPAVVTRLTEFGTRHTLSDTTSPTRGIGAARNWIKSEMEAASQAGGGRLLVSFEEFEQPKTNRVPKALQVVNVVGMLPGSMPEAASRRYYVVGHY